MKVETVVVVPVVYVVVPVDVVLETDVEELAVELEVEPTVEEVVDEIGVQLGRVIVPFPHPPDEHSTMQFLAQAASPEVVEVCQH